MFLSVLTKLAALLSLGPFYGSVQDCAKGSSIFAVESVALEPATPVSGQNVTLLLSYTVPEGTTITDGTAQYDVTYNYIPFQPTVEPLCQNIPCPLGPGTYQNASTSVWPQDLSGLLTTKMKWIDPQGDLLLCVEISGQVGDLRSVALVPAPRQTRSLRRRVGGTA